MSEDILRGIVKLADDAPGALTVQVEDIEPDDPDSELEMFEPVGVHFLPSLDEDVLVVAIGGAPDNRVVLGASGRGHRPTGLTDPGTGGLHLLGTFKVFLDADGTLHLGERDASDFVTLQSLVDAEFTRIYDAVANWIPGAVPMDGGAAVATSLKLAFSTASAAAQPTGSTVIKAV